MIAEKQSAPEQDVVVDIRRLHKSFGDQRALDGIDLSLRSGHVTALIGENGSGKSTLIKCLTGVYQPDGRGQLHWGPGLSAASCVAVHQDVGLVPGLTVAENFGLSGGFVRGLFGRISWRKHNKAVAETLARSGVSIHPLTNVDDLSVAQKTSVAIARAIGRSEGVKVVILDEPTAALPLDDRAEVLALVSSLAADGLSVLYVSHHLDEIVQIADSVVVLRAGSISHSVENDGLDADALVAMMSGDAAAARDTLASAAAPGEAVLSVTGLSTDLVRDFELTLHRGEVVGLHGAPDSGVSDICRSIAGLIDYSGEIALGGTTLPAHSVRSRISSGVFLVPGDRRGEGIIADLSVEENLSLAPLRQRHILSPVSTRGERKRALEVMERLDVRPRDPARKLGMLSGGNQQKVVIARALAQYPTVLVLENPTQGVDPAARKQIRRLIRDAVAGGVSVIVSDVDEQEVLAVADRVISLEDGTAAERHTGSTE